LLFVICYLLFIIQFKAFMTFGNMKVFFLTMLLLLNIVNLTMGCGGGGCREHYCRIMVKNILFQNNNIYSKIIFFTAEKTS
jgi:hypothetical protein